MDSLPYFWKLAENQIKYAGKRSRTINIKIAINTVRMMIENEKAKSKELSFIKIAKWINSPAGKKELNATHEFMTKKPNNMRGAANHKGVTMTKDEINKALCEKLGICYHVFNSKDSKRALARAPIWGGSGRECKKCGISINAPKREDNPDFFSPAGRIELLKIMTERKDWADFHGSLFWPTAYGRINEMIPIVYVLDNTGTLAEAALEFLSKVKP